MNALLPPPDDMPAQRQAVLDWFVRRQRDVWSDGEEAQFQSWLQADGRHQQMFDQWSANWHALDAMPIDVVNQMRRNLQRDKQVQAAAEHAASRRRLMKPWFAAAALAGVFSMTGWLGWSHWQSQPVFTQAFSTEQGQQLQSSLPDGSELRLDVTTRLQVNLYRGRREVVLLDGQAVFDVSPDAARPFLVMAGPAAVTVIGTRFSVRHTPGVPGEDGARIAVEEGRVKVVPMDAGGQERPSQAVFLDAGQQLVVSAQGLLSPVARVHADGIAPWREYRVSFVDASLSQALAEFERYRRTGLTVSDPAVAQLRLSGTFDPRDVQTLRQVLPMALPVRLQSRGSDTEVLPAR